MYSKVRDLIRAAFKTTVINIDTAAGKQQFTIVAVYIVLVKVELSLQK